MQEQQLANFEGWALVEIMGHQSAAGYVTTQYFGGTAVFRVVQQEKPAEEVTLERDQYFDGNYLYAGSKIRVSRPRAETYVAASSLYRMTPCTEAQAQQRQPTVIEVIEWAERKALLSPDDRLDNEEEGDEDDDES